MAAVCQSTPPPGPEFLGSPRRAHHNKHAWRARPTAAKRSSPHSPFISGHPRRSRGRRRRTRCSRAGGGLQRFCLASRVAFGACLQPLPSTRPLPVRREHGRCVGRLSSQGRSAPTQRPIAWCTSRPWGKSIRAVLKSEPGRSCRVLLGFRDRPLHIPLHSGTALGLCFVVK